MEESIKKLKFNLQETQFPYFAEEDLTYLLEQYPDINEASYEGCLIKAQDDSVSLGPINTPSNEAYWLRRAKHFQRKFLRSGNARASKNASGCIKRVDEF